MAIINQQHIFSSNAENLPFCRVYQQKTAWYSLEQANVTSVSPRFVLFYIPNFFLNSNSASPWEMPRMCCFWTSSPGRFLCQTEHESLNLLRKALATKPRCSLSASEKVNVPIRSSLCGLASCVSGEKRAVPIFAYRKKGQESSLLHSLACPYEHTSNSCHQTSPESHDPAEPFTGHCADSSVEQAYSV